MRHTGSVDPLLTVIVPGHNVEAYVDEALASLQGQRFGAWRAILVDDASSDGTGAAFARAAASDPRFTLVTHDRRRGLAAARNTGLDLVTTEFVAFFDSDDVLPDTAYERLVGTLQRSGSDLVVGAYARLRPDDAGQYALGIVQPWVAAATDPERHGLTLAEHPQVTGNIVAWSKVSRAAFWREHDLRFPDGVLYEDQLVAQQLYVAAGAFDVIPDVVCHWRIRAEGTSITQHEAALPVLIACLDAMRSGLAVLEASGVDVAVQARLDLMLRMDVPRLAEIAATHPEPAYRACLGAFTRDIWDAASPQTRATVNAAVGSEVLAEVVPEVLTWR